MLRVRLETGAPRGGAGPLRTGKSCTISIDLVYGSVAGERGVDNACPARSPRAISGKGKLGVAVGKKPFSRGAHHRSGEKKQNIQQRPSFLTIPYSLLCNISLALQAVSLAAAGVVALSASPALALNMIELQDERTANKEGLQLIYEVRECFFFFVLLSSRPSF